MDLELFTQFLGKITLINMVVLLFTTLVLVVFGKRVSIFHARMFVIDEARVREMYFSYLANFKILVVILNLVPYLCLRFW